MPIRPENSARYIYILRNPWGAGAEEMRDARLWACDEIERLQRQLAQAQGLASAGMRAAFPEIAAAHRDDFPDDYEA